MKERRKLIIVPREAPYSTPHLKAMANLSEWGVVVLPASPGFYHSPQSIEDLVDFVVARSAQSLVGSGDFDGALNLLYPAPPPTTT